METGKCPPGYHFNGSACVRLGSEGDAAGSGDATPPVPAPGQPLAAPISPRDQVAAFLGQRSQNAAQATDARCGGHA